MFSKQEIESILTAQFPLKHVTAALAHYLGAVEKYQSSDWEAALLKSGKFIEATLKALLIHCGLSVPPAKRFKVSNSVRNLEQASSTYDETVRLLIPRGCSFLYDITSNRGARHDPDKIDPNKMDASIAIPLISWILAEMIRFASGNGTPGEIGEQIESLIEKKYPHIENIEGRLYINIRGLSPRELGLLLLDAHYPGRISRAELAASMLRHGAEKNSTAIALTRLKNLVDDVNGNWKLRGIGRQEAEEILSKRVSN